LEASGGGESGKQVKECLERNGRKRTGEMGDGEWGRVVSGELRQIRPRPVRPDETEPLPDTNRPGRKR